MNRGRKTNIRAHSRKSRSKESRLSKLEKLVQELKQESERRKNPNQQMMYFVAPGGEPPDPETLPPDAVVVYFERSPGQLELEEKYKGQAELVHAEYKARLQEQAQPKEKLAQQNVDNVDPEGGEPAAATKQFDQNGERVTAEGYGVRWGEFEPIGRRHRGT